MVTNYLPKDRRSVLNQSSSKACSASGGYTKYQSGRRYVWTGSSVVLPEPVLVRLDSQEGQDYGIHGERVRNACWEYLCQSKAMELKKLIHAVMHLGVLMHWFPAYTTLQPKEKSSVIEVRRKLIEHMKECYEAIHAHKFQLNRELHATKHK
nr:hypothetical protein [Tanacetum cinerariifolium]